MIMNILANDNAEDYYSESRSDNYFDDQESLREDEDQSDDSNDDSEIDESYKFNNSMRSFRSSKQLWMRKSQLGLGTQQTSSKRVLRIMSSLLQEIS